MTARKLPSTAAATAASRKRRRRRATAGWLAAVVTAMLVVLTAVLPLTRDHDGLARARHGARHPQHSTTIEPSAAHRRGRRHPVPPPSTQAELTIGARAGVTRVPRSFFGLSTEYGALPLYERHVALFERVLSLLRVPGDGPLILRIGGDSADRTFWDPSLRSMPSWAFRLTPTWVAKLSALVLRERLRLILDLNLITGKPAIAAQWARAAEALLPRRSIVGFEVGNEPDLYAQWYWLASIGRTRLAADILPRALSAGIYTHDFQAYAHALSTIAPGVPLAGPALANPQGALSWITSLIAAPHPGLGIVSAHRYPFSPCVNRTSPEYPTTERLLSQAASAGLARSVRGAVAQAHRAGLIFRLTELNSVTCGGLKGVSDTFATALWAPDTLFEMLRAGVDGVNVHIRATTINAPFSLGDRGLRARPLLYGLLMFVRTLGRNAALVRSHLHARPSLHLTAWAVRVQGHVLHVLLIDKGSRAVRVQLRLPARGPATVARLLAPSLQARSRVTLAGQHVGPAGEFVGSRTVQTVRPGAHGYTLTIPRGSEALVSVGLARGALSGGRRR